jgi:hypothetical protein
MVVLVPAGIWVLAGCTDSAAGPVGEVVGDGEVVGLADFVGFPVVGFFAGDDECEADTDGVGWCPPVAAEVEACRPGRVVDGGPEDPPDARGWLSGTPM